MTSLTILLSVVPSAAPGNVEGYNTSASTIRVSWTALTPQDQNGIIINYIIRYKAQTGSFSDGDEKTLQISDSATQANLTGLEAFVGYNISVTAATSVGEGPSSILLVVTTAEAGKLLCSNSRC